MNNKKLRVESEELRVRHNSLQKQSYCIKSISLSQAHSQLSTLNSSLAIILATLLLTACFSGSYENAQKLHVEMLNVGQGLSFLIQGEHCNTLYDTGTPNSGIDTMLQNRGIKTLCSVIVSHQHNDHSGGLSSLEKMEQNGEISIKRVLLQSDLSRGDTLADFLPWTARIIYAEEIAMRISDGKNSFLFMADLEKKHEKHILELEPLLTATALQVGHHGSRTSSSWDFLAQIQPKMVLISVGKNNSYKHPHPETLANLRLILPDTTQIFRTDIDGNVEIEWVYGVGMWKSY